ncbi:9397_t:CDS:1, partial [Scutellospora calospora]
VDLHHLSAAYSTSFLPKPYSCDYCKSLLGKDDEIVLICGHKYHILCYNRKNRKCVYCEKYYKREIFENVNSFLKQIEKGADILTPEDFEDNETAEESEEKENSEEIKNEKN